MSTVHVKWIESKLMMGVDSFGHPLVMSSWPEREPQWAGLKPSDLLLLAAGSCSMYDVVEILQKQRQPLLGLEVTCTGEQATEPVYRFTHIHMHFRAVGDIVSEKLERAIQLLAEKYCSITNSLNVEISRDFEIVPAS
ncbi:MAG: OsmC family protein [Anaerolineales bacterium]